jgi:integrase
MLPFFGLCCRLLPENRALTGEPMATFEERIDQDGRRVHRVKVRLKGFPPQTATFERLTDARRWASKAETEIKEGKYFRTSDGKKKTFKQAATRYETEFFERHPSKAKSQQHQLDWWVKELGDKYLADITPAVITEARQKLANLEVEPEERRSPSTLNRYVALLSHILSVAVREWQWLEDSPIKRVKKLKEPRGRVRFLSDKERERLLEKIKTKDSPQLELFVVLALSTGMRKGEIQNLTWEDVDLNRGMIIIQNTKNGDRRAVGLASKALQLLKEYSKVRRIDSQLLFPGVDPSKPIDIRSAWETALKNAEISDFRFHDLRHSAASYLAMNGATLAEIAEVLGHRTLSMVKRYAHLTETHTAKVVERMNEKIFG